MVQRLAARVGATLLVVLASVFTAMLRSHLGQEVLLVSTPVSGRSRPEFDDVIGCFYNSVFIRADVSGDPSFVELVRRVRESTAGALAHQHTDLDRVLAVDGVDVVDQLKFALQDLRSLQLTRPLAPWMEPASVRVRSGGATRRDLHLQVWDWAQEVQLMFVQTADDIQVNPTEKTFRLVDVNQQTLYFADRPERLAGHYKMDDYLKEWTEGDNNFGEDPPNATLSIYEPGQAGNSIVVVEISNPVVEGDDIVYSYQLIEGTMPAQGGATAIFIDWVPARPGVGAGGVGKPGVVGVRV
jgi:hypothetical protein